MECKGIHAEDKVGFWAVLIETYWNVKFSSSVIGIEASSGINRNILECKDQTQSNDNEDDEY